MSYTNVNLQVFAEKTGIHPVTGTRLYCLNDMARQAAELIQIIALERSGIRDGDGYWHGSDPLSSTVQTISEILGCLEEGPGMPDGNYSAELEETNND